VYCIDDTDDVTQAYGENISYGATRESHDQGNNIVSEWIYLGWKPV
jgi:hypothetical protein